ncbi:MAG TPA: SDR family oxidoreductase, partial [Ktedonobacterales bacterium]|nr:SDR family oxidoreductase [Ktedonobacterales bacterium]
AGKVAIIVGASQGIGAVVARAFAAAGASTVLAARNESALNALAAEIGSGGGQAMAIPADVSDPGSVERLVAQTIEAFGRLDAAFNNAGANHPPTPLADISVEEFDRIVAVNLRGVFLAMKYEVAAMLAHPTGHGGAIVNMSSTAGLSGVPRVAAYTASKHGVIGLTQTAALDYATQNIRINAIAPGTIASDRLAALPEETRQRIASTIPMRRLGQPAEVGALVTWLCSDQASFITGATITIDGGRSAGGA